jgi:uncharacterized protein (DUF58 family)
MRGSYWPWIIGLLVILGLLLQQIPLLLVAFLLFMVWGVTFLWEHYCLARLEYRRRLSASRVFFGEQIYLELEIDNRKPLPLPWVEIDDEMPEGVTFLTGSTNPSHKSARVHLTNLLSLGWYHRVRRRYQIGCNQRGVFTFGPTLIRSGDLFGFSRRQMELAEFNRLTVYPRILPVEQDGIPSKQPLGDIRIKRYIFQDPVLTMGVRDYHYGDSLKRIHWKATARLGQLQTKVYEPTTSVDMGIMLDVRTTVPPSWGIVTQLQELGIITAASMANQAMENGYRVGLYINQLGILASEPIRIPPSQHGDQMLHILESLAQIHSSLESVSIARFISQESRLLPWGSTIVVITAVPTQALLSTLIRMKRAGRSVALIIVGRPRTAGILTTIGLAVYHIDADTPWQEVEAIRLQGER